MSKKSTLLCVNEKISPVRNYKLVLPSQLNSTWLKNIQHFSRREIKLLYVGRIKIEKGVFSLLDLFGKIKLNLPKQLTMVGHGKKLKIISDDVKILEPISKEIELIKIYDNHNIVVLPSFTEGHPQVLLEALARKRPVIIFEEIAFVKKYYEGVFVCKRNPYDFQKTINFIFENFDKISRDMEKNKLPLREDFIKQLVKFMS